MNKAARLEMTGPMADVRVLDAATFLAAPFCGTILAEFGAEVIKIEQPGGGDSLRRFGTMTECGDTLVWMSEARNKKSVTLDLRKPQGAELFRRLAAKSDVVLENFRPGTMDRWGLGYAELSKLNPRLVMLSVSAYGQTGPKKTMPGFARTAHGFSGLAYLSGEPGRTPVVPGSTSLADYVSGLFGAIGVLMALRHAQRSGQGQQVDVALYESMFRLLDELVPAYARNGFQRERMGADTVNVVPHSNYATADGAWIALACSNDRMWTRLAHAMDRPELAEHPDFATTPQRNTHRQVVNDLVADWARHRSCADILERCAREQVPCSKLFSISDIFQDPHYAARGNIADVHDSRLGSLKVPAGVPRLSKTPSDLRHAGPALGSANNEIYGNLLNLDEGALSQLSAQGII